MTTLTPLPPMPSLTDDRTTFSGKMTALVEAMAVMVTEINALMPAMLAAQAGLPISIPLTFSTTTSDADPGAGTIRFNATPQNTATALFVDLTSADSGNPDITSLLDWLDDSTSTTSKGVIKIYETSTAANYIYFSLTSWTTASGYRKLTVAVLAASAANPFGNGDGLTFQFWRNGDIGSFAGGIALSNASISGIKEATANGEIVAGSTTPGGTPTSGAITVTWPDGKLQKQTEPTGSITYTFTAPTGSKPTYLQLKILSDGTSTAQTITWPASVKWLGATWAGANNKNAFITFYFDGTTYWGIGINEA